MKTLAIAAIFLFAAACSSHHTRYGNEPYRAGAPTQGEQLVCHKGKKTLSLPASAVEAHLGHGDRRGPC